MIFSTYTVEIVLNLPHHSKERKQKCAIEIGTQCDYFYFFYVDLHIEGATIKIEHSVLSLSFISLHALYKNFIA